MKLKDIEGKLKKEQNSQQVPDVLQRAKKAPINRLLDGQTPLRAFDKQTAVRLLWCAMLLLVATVLAIGAIALIPKGTRDQVELCYVNLKVECSGETTTYGMVVENGQTVAVFVKEKQNESVVLQNLNKKGDSVENAIKDVYQSKTLDKVSICVLCEKDAASMARVIASLFDGNAAVVEISQNSAQVVADIQGYIGDTTSSSAELINKYLAKF